MISYKIEVLLNDEQKHIYNKTVGTCRYVYNLFINENQNKYNNKLKYMNNFEFSKWLNNIYSLENKWIKDVSSKAIRNTIDNAHKSYQKFFKIQKQGPKYTKDIIVKAQRQNRKLTMEDLNGFPKYKSKHKNDCSFYFTRTSKTQLIKHERHRIKVPCLGWVRLREFGYLPIDAIITSGRITKKNDKYFVSIIVDGFVQIQQNNINDGIGIDLGLKDFAILSNGTVFKTKKHKKLYKRLKREQRKLSRKYEMNKTKIKRGEVTKGIESQKMIVAKIHQKITNIRNDYHNKIISELINRQPKFITIENLNVKGMMKNKHLAKVIANQSFASFIEKLKHKAKLNSIEIRQVDRFFPSSKLCNSCGNIKSDLKLKDRVYVCECGYTEDRDVNAAKNLKDAIAYKIA